MTSIEAYDSEQRMIIQFFGKRKEGQGERDDWRLIATTCPCCPRSSAAVKRNHSMTRNRALVGLSHASSLRLCPWRSPWPVAGAAADQSAETGQPRRRDRRLGDRDYP